MKMGLHWKILIGIVIGAVVGFIAIQFQGGKAIVYDWISPFGTIYIKLLKLIAVPLIFFSLIKGISDMKDISSLSKLGYKTLALYLTTTLFAVILGLSLVNIFSPGNAISADTIQGLSIEDQFNISDKIEAKTKNSAKGPLNFFVEIVPDNLFSALQQNGKLLQVIFFTLFFGISLLLIDPRKQKIVKTFFDGINEVMLKIVDVIIMFSPYAVVALIATLVCKTNDPEVFKALLGYSIVILIGMTIMLLLYPLIIKLVTGVPILKFVKGILPAQLVAFSTSSSMATLPVTMDCLEENLEIDNQVISFVCPIGATINMDATSLMQAIAAVFVCQVLGHDIGWSDQLTIVLTATLASIGAAAAPSAGIIMLVIVLESVGFPQEQLPIALAMILAVDRPLDMCRTVVNITGDSFVAVLMDHTIEGKNIR